MREALFTIIMVITTLAGCATTVSAPNDSHRTVSATARRSHPTPNYNWDPCTAAEAGVLSSPNGQKWRYFCDYRTKRFMAGCPIGEDGKVKIDHCASSHGYAECGYGGCWPLPIQLSGFPPFVEASQTRNPTWN